MGNRQSAKKASPAREIGRKITMGIMLGMAIGWVLIKRITRERSSSVPIAGAPTLGEIDITQPHIILEETEQPVEPAADGPDDLEAIHGIGPAYARRLREAGIHTFEVLARQSPEKLAEIVQARAWQAIDPQAWIDQARERLQSPG